MRNQYLESIIFGCIIYPSTVKCRNSTGRDRKQGIVPSTEGQSALSLPEHALILFVLQRHPSAPIYVFFLRSDTILHCHQGRIPIVKHITIILFRIFLRVSEHSCQGNFPYIPHSLISSLCCTEGMPSSQSFNLVFI